MDTFSFPPRAIVRISLVCVLTRGHICGHIPIKNSLKKILRAKMQSLVAAYEAEVRVAYPISSLLSNANQNKKLSALIENRIQFEHISLQVIEVENIEIGTKHAAESAWHLAESGRHAAQSAWYFWKAFHKGCYPVIAPIAYTGGALLVAWGGFVLLRF